MIRCMDRPCITDMCAPVQAPSLERTVELSTLVPLMDALRRRLRKRRRVPWQQPDFCEPDHPRALVRLVDLKQLEA